MSEVEHEEILALIAAYALNSLDPDDTELVDRHLPACEICRAELDAYEAVVDVLPLGTPDAQPSSALKGRLMANIDHEPASESVAPPIPVVQEPRFGQRISEALESFFRGPRWRPVAVLIVIGLVVSNVILWQQLTAPDPNAWRRVRLTATEIAPEARGIIYISADGLNGTLIVDGLPQLGSKEQYQLWLIEDGERISGGVFSVDNDGYRGKQIESADPLQNYGAFGITIEPAGGSPGPTGERVLGYNL